MTTLDTPALTVTEMDARITFHTADKIMEADFANVRFDTTLDVNAFYDRLESRIRDTGETLWFFLVNLNGTRIEPAAWTAYSRRGRALNLAHSMGSVRFDASEETRRQILRAANTEAFDPNLFSDREAALTRIRSLPNKRRAKIVHEPNYTAEEIAARVTFDPDTVIMHADFSNMTFHHSRDVDDFYDHLEAKIIESDRRWFFLVNLNGCKILPGAWVRYAHRGKRLNEAGSLGSVRFAAGSETAETIRMRSESQNFRPNIRNTREEGLELIAEMRAKIEAQLS
ncbi:MAG: hypothetical protein AAF280_01920 [Pseudomonadota bacterium]